MTELVDFTLQQHIAHEIYRQQMMQRLPGKSGIVKKRISSRSVHCRNVLTLKIVRSGTGTPFCIVEM